MHRYLELNIILTVTFIFIALVGVMLIRHNLIMILLIAELIFLCASLNFIASSYVYDDVNGQITVLFILTIAAVETVIGLSILVFEFQVRRVTESTNVNDAL